ncbi:MAG: TMEM175 family protein [Proteobacteria bacterium]|nr:TMEM175 family protein [Pseudomonadota bacterium]
MNADSKEINVASKISLRRLQTLTDCIFALALILLVIFIEKPTEGMKPTEENIKKYIFGQLDTVAVYIITFLNIAFYWFFNHNQSKHFRRSDGVHIWLTLLTLMFVGLLPYSNALNVVFYQSFSVHIFYSAIVFVIGLLFCIDWLYATRDDRLVDRSISPGTVEELIVESLVQPVAALLSFGGALISTFWWEMPFLIAPFAIFAISKLWECRRTKRANTIQSE